MYKTTLIVPRVFHKWRSHGSKVWSLLWNSDWLIFQSFLRGTSSSKILKKFMLQFSEIVSWDWKICSYHEMWLLLFLYVTRDQGAVLFVLNFHFAPIHFMSCETCQHGGKRVASSLISEIYWHLFQFWKRNTHNFLREIRRF